MIRMKFSDSLTWSTFTSFSFPLWPSSTSFLTLCWSSSFYLSFNGSFHYFPLVKQSKCDFNPKQKTKTKLMNQTIILQCPPHFCCFSQQNPLPKYTRLVFDSRNHLNLWPTSQHNSSLKCKSSVRVLSVIQKGNWLQVDDIAQIKWQESNKSSVI